MIRRLVVGTLIIHENLVLKSKTEPMGVLQSSLFESRNVPRSHLLYSVLLAQSYFQCLEDAFWAKTWNQVAGQSRTR